MVVIRRRDKIAARAARSAGQPIGPDQEWALDDLIEMPFADALAIRPSLAMHGPGGGPDETYNYCRHFDYVTRRCSHYESRPPVCRDFPWYNGPTNVARVEDLPGCGYWSDISFWRASGAGLAEVAA